MGQIDSKTRQTKIYIHNSMYICISDTKHLGFYKLYTQTRRKIYLCENALDFLFILLYI